MNQNAWYVALGGEARGPYSTDEVRELAAKGDVNAATLIWHHPMPDWRPLEQVQEFGMHIPPPLPATHAPPEIPQDVINEPTRVIPDGRPHSESVEMPRAASHETEPSRAAAIKELRGPLAPVGELPLGVVLAPWADVPSQTNERGTLWSEAEPVLGSSGHTHPWRRLFARTTDYAIFGGVLGLLLGVLTSLFAPNIYEVLFEVQGGEWVLTLLTIGLWVPVEGHLLATRGTTPGKWLLSLQVGDSNGRRLSWERARERASAVWVRGMAFGIPFVTAIAQLVAVTKLERRGETTWDADLGTVVHAEPLQAGRVVATVAMIALALWLAGMDATGAF